MTNALIKYIYIYKYVCVCIGGAGNSNPKNKKRFYNLCYCALSRTARALHDFIMWRGRGKNCTAQVLSNQGIGGERISL